MRGKGLLHCPEIIQFLFRLHDYSTTKGITIFCGTWNLNGRVRWYPLVGTLVLTAMPSHHLNHCCHGFSLDQVSALQSFHGNHSNGAFLGLQEYVHATTEALILTYNTQP